MRGVDRVTPVVAGPVFDVADVRLPGAAAALQEHRGEFEVGVRRSAGNVVDGADLAALEHVQHGARVVVDVEPVANLQAVAVNGNGEIVDQIGDKERHDLLGILMRAVGVAAARDQHRRAERFAVRQRHQIGSCLACRIRTARTQSIALFRLAVRDVAVDFIGRNLEIAWDLLLANGFEQHVRS